MNVFTLYGVHNDETMQEFLFLNRIGQELFDLAKDEEEPLIIDGKTVVPLKEEK